MVTLRCTKKLLSRLHLPKPIGDTVASPSEPPTISKTALGDWYATLLFVRPKHLALFVSEHSRLAVLLEAAPLSTLTPRFRSALREVLHAVGVSEAAIAKEEAEMISFTVGPTQSRSVLGTMNEYVKTLEMLQDTADFPASLLEQSMFLNQVICKPLDWQHPDEVTRRLLSNKEPTSSQPR